MPAPTPDVLQQLLKDARITGDRLETAVSRALDVNYWRALVPDFGIERDAPALECMPVDAAAVDAAISAHRVDGYFRLPAAVAPAGIARLNAAIDTIVGAGWPPSFLFMYDEAWLSARSPATNRVLDAILGKGFRQIQHVWVHVVKPVPGAFGWRPHLDGSTQNRMTIWLALTDATIDNGCMHVIPRRVSATPPDLATRFTTPDSQFTRDELTSLLHATHALVAAPGDALGWGYDVIHWGGFAHASGRTRRGFSFEYIAASEEPDDHDGTIVAMDTLPSFEERVRDVAAGLVAYRTFEPMTDRFTDVAREITKRLSPAG